MATTKAYKQDLPPKGGYAPINFKRIPARVIFGGKAQFPALKLTHNS